MTTRQAAQAFAQAHGAFEAARTKRQAFVERLARLQASIAQLEATVAEREKGRATALVNAALDAAGEKALTRARQEHAEADCAYQEAAELLEAMQRQERTIEGALSSAKDRLRDTRKSYFSALAEEKGASINGAGEVRKSLVDALALEVIAANSAAVDWQLLLGAVFPLPTDQEFDDAMRRMKTKFLSSITGE